MMRGIGDNGDTIFNNGDPLRSHEHTAKFPNIAFQFLFQVPDGATILEIRLYAVLNLLEVRSRGPMYPRTALV